MPFSKIPWGGTGNSACLDCCCGSGTGSAVLRARGMKPVSYDNQPSQIALGFLRGNLEADETCCIDATIASRYLDPAEYGTGLMLGDINGTNAGIWEQIVRELLVLSRSTVITVVSEREARRIGRWCREFGRDVEVSENTRHPIFDHWVCCAHSRD